MKRINVIALIVLQSFLAVITILTNHIIIDMIFMSFTFILLVKLFSLARYFVFDYVKESEKGEY